MKFPFTIDEFQDVFKAYNNNIWPFQLILVALALLIVIVAVKKPGSNSLIFSVLGSLWIWTGVVYHLVYFTAINNAAYLFGILFFIQGCIFFSLGASGTELFFRFRKDLYGITGAFLIFFSILIYPALNYFLGHVYPYSPTFGLPCPTTIFTLGLMLWLQQKFSFWVMVIPLLWSMIGFSAAFNLDMKEDISLGIAGLITLILLLTKRITFKRNARSRSSWAKLA
jgi:hypothetical protein